MRCHPFGDDDIIPLHHIPHGMQVLPQHHLEAVAYALVQTHLATRRQVVIRPNILMLEVRQQNLHLSGQWSQLRNIVRICWLEFSARFYRQFS